MGRKVDLTPEEQRLKDLVREAHEAAQHLWDAISVASKLAPTLVAEFEATHHREMAQLSNHMTSEGNRAATDLNAAVEVARGMILSQLAAQELVLDPATNTIRLQFNDLRFDDQVPPPFPNHQTKETDQ